jgi:hypothetical protein
MIPRSLPPAQRNTQLTRILAAPRPAAFPAFGRVRVDPADRIWIEDYTTGSLWNVFDSAGKFLGKLTLPRYDGAATELVALERDAVVLMHRDKDGAKRLSFVRLLPATPTSR